MEQKDREEFQVVGTPSNSGGSVSSSLCLGGRSHEAYSSSFVYVCICLSVCLSVGRISRRSLKTKR